MSLKDMYQYVWYKLYKFLDNEVFHYLADWRAGVVVGVLQMAMIISLLFCIQLLTHRHMSILNSLFPWLLIILFSIISITTAFGSKEKCNAIIEKFDAWPQKKNDWGGVIAWFAIFAMIAFIIITFRMYFKVDWSIYR